MDALKKAEEEKKKAAKRLEQVEANTRDDDSGDDNLERDLDDSGEHVNADLLTETMKLSLEPLDAQGNKEAISQLEIATVEAIEPEIVVDEKAEQEDKETTGKLSIDEFEISEDLTVENKVFSGAASQEAFEETQQAIDLNDTTIIEGLSTENVSAPFDDTFHGVLFEDEEESTEIYEETLPGVPADQLIKDIGGGEFQPTPVAAQTVFSAGRSKKDNRTSWGIFFVLAILAFGSFGVFYYFTITPVARKLPSPIVARGIESLSAPGAALSQFEEAEAKEVISATIISEKVEEPMAVDSSEPESNLDKSIEPETTTGIQEENQSTDIAINNAQAGPEMIEESSNADEPMDETEAPTIEVAKKEEVVTQSQPVIEKQTEAIKRLNPEALKISKKKSPLKQNAMISEAYKDYQAGQLDSAEKLYRNALQDAPENRDVHLGLAAIAISKGDKESAYGHYLKLLDVNPSDAFALSSLITLSNNSDPVKDESIIKNLIHKEDKVPYLFFALGNVYAKQERWAEAQQAFFDAYTLDTKNPDYALNLAVSLDKIGQFPAALDFYNVALELAQKSNTKFNWSSVNDRIQVLNQSQAKTQ